MLLKRVVLLGFILCLVLSSGYLVWSHCHNTETCEDLPNHLVSGDSWSTSNDNQVDYYINTLHNYGRPVLTPDVTAADNAWSGIRFNGVDIDFSVVYQGTTYQSPGGASDGVNTVGWKNLGSEDWRPLAYAYTYPGNPTTRIVEADIGFNYYKLYDEHGSPDDTEYCIQNVTTHEFGH